MVDAETAPPSQVRIGGLDGAGLLAELRRGGIALNERALELLASPVFQTVVPVRTISLGIADVAGLGFAQGATWPELLAAAARRSWQPAPLALAPWLRLQWPGQAEVVAAPTRHRAPPGSLTVVSPEPADPTQPRGFYLRRADGQVWLRGYQSDDLHVWDASDRLAFAIG
ncbi:hypothetical protein [Rubrivivax gelatinosus]|uniref:hypothetical protein n=1 Tax=Rubrivivax gelatinosus TaxID=28068 RepID=UPI0002FAA55A|nr:hypothetical protein [Rubrivivax gelatinosus]